LAALYLRDGVCQGWEAPIDPHSQRYLADPCFVRYKLLAGIGEAAGPRDGHLRFTDKEGNEHDLPVSLHPTDAGETLVIALPRL
jgi:hypothetical protein